MQIEPGWVAQWHACCAFEATFLPACLPAYLCCLLCVG